MPSYRKKKERKKEAKKHTKSKIKMNKRREKDFQLII